MLGLLSLVLLASACSELQYYRQSAGGQLDIVQRRQAIDSLVADENQDAGLRAHLARVSELRAFAIRELGLPDTGSYTQYADLGRDYAVLGLYAAPEFSVELKTWCYPVVGCAAYRGYFDRPMLSAYAEDLQQQAYDTYIAVVPAYSTLGWFDDPVLNTVLDWPDPQLAGLIFHELAHQEIYVKGDTVFNESFATAVERLGVERWLEQQADRGAVKTYRDYWLYHGQVIDLIVDARDELQKLYRRDMSPQDKRAAKQLHMERLRDRYLKLRTGMSFDPGFDAWFAAELNNAKLGAVAAYHHYIEAFFAIMEQQGDFRAFYSEVARIGKLAPEQREKVLAQIP